jgi:hypothetical protein
MALMPGKGPGRKNRLFPLIQWIWDAGCGKDKEFLDYGLQTMYDICRESYNRPAK